VLRQPPSIHHTLKHWRKIQAFFYSTDFNCILTASGGTEILMNNLEREGMRKRR